MGTYMYTYVYTRERIEKHFMRAYKCLRLCVNVYAWMCMRVHMCVHVRICLCVHVRVCVMCECIWSCICTCARVCHMRVCKSRYSIRMHQAREKRFVLVGGRARLASGGGSSDGLLLQ